MLIQIASQAWGLITDDDGRSLQDVPVTIANLDGTRATTWSAPAGGSSSATVLTTDSSGYIPRYIAEGTYLMSARGVTQQVEAVASGDSADNEALERIADWLMAEAVSDSGNVIATGLLRSVQSRRPTGAVLYPGAIDLWAGESDVPEDPGSGSEPEIQDDTATGKSLNTTSAALALQFFARYAMTSPRSARRRELIRVVQQFADEMLLYQWGSIDTTGTDKGLRRGGFKLAPSDSRATSFGTGLAGRAMLSAYYATGQNRYLQSAINACDFLVRMSDPNTYWNASYAVNPINRTVGGVEWRGFCDRVDGGDKITTTCAPWNLIGAWLLKEVGEFTGTSTYTTIATQARDFMATGVIDGRDFFAVQSQLFTGKINTSIGTGDTSVAYTQTSAQNAPATPFSFSFYGETCTCTAITGGGSVGATGTITFTRSGSPTTQASGRHFQAVSTYVNTQWTQGTNQMWNDHAWHRAGDLVQSGTNGTDQVEYGLKALWHLGYNVATLQTTYNTYRNLPHTGALTGNGLPAAENSDGGTFGLAYAALGGACFCGYFRLGTVGINGRPDRHYGTYLDSQGAGTLAGFKALLAPSDYIASLPILREATYHAGLLDQFFQTKWATATGYDYATKGVIVIAGAGLGLLDAREGIA